jgi:formylglycine-generating enzyme required for sulfatase activity
VESPEFGTRIYDLAGNGREWTRELYANNRESVPLAPDRLRKLKPDDETVRVTLRGRSYLASRPLRYEDLEGEDAVPDTHQYQRPAEDIGFRVVIEP